MNDLSYRFIEPLDVLFLRGNQSFGDPGSHGDAVMPPWPSVAAGAIRSRILADDGTDLPAFGKGNVAHPSLGTPAQPGSFVLSAFHVARQGADGKIELLLAPPADLVIRTADESEPEAHRLTPTPPPPGILSSSPLPRLPVLAQAERGKAASGWWLRQAGWQKYLHGQVPARNDLVNTSTLWGMDERVGVGLAVNTRSAEDGRLFTNRAVAMTSGVGFVAAISGAHVPDQGLLRLGGDGHAASITAASLHWPEPDYNAIAAAGRCRLVLTSPGLFTGGWLPNGCTKNGSGDIRFDLHGVTGKLVAASVARSEIVSGWDLARWQPKPAQRIAPSGSVYWLDELKASADALRKLARDGLWSVQCEDPARRAEGFNRLCIARY